MYPAQIPRRLCINDKNEERCMGVYMKVKMSIVSGSPVPDFNYVSRRALTKDSEKRNRLVNLEVGITLKYSIEIYLIACLCLGIVFSRRY